MGDGTRSLTTLTDGPMISFSRRLWTATLTLLLGAGSFAACSGDNPADEQTCIPGDNIFCRCVGGRAGTKLCLDDGKSFGPCETERGACTEVEDNTTSGGQGGNDLPGDGPKPNPGELLDIGRLREVLDWPSRVTA